MRIARSAVLGTLAAIALATGAGSSACQGGPGNAPDGGAPEPYPDSTTVIVAGYVWDPEALQYSFGMCGPACSLRPITMPGQAYFERSLVGAAQVELWDQIPGSVTYSAVSSDAGAWFIPEVVRAPEPLLYATARKARNGPPSDGGSPDSGAPDGGGSDGGTSDAGSTDAGSDAGLVDAGEVDAGSPDAGSPDAGPPDAGSGDAGRADGGATDAGATDAGAPPPFQGPIPTATTYYPTVSVTPPISPHLYQCVGRPAAVIGNNGILEAVAKHLTNTGRPTVTADFVDPQKFGGVVIWWAYASGGSTTRQGASGVTFTASAGQLVYVNWGCPAGATCPPGPPIPAPGMASKSARNFYVMPGGTSSNVGIAVVLLPPAGAAPAVTVTITDPVVDSTRSRPYAFELLPAVTAIPGKIHFGQAQAIPALVTEPAAYECLPEK